MQAVTSVWEFPVPQLAGGLGSTARKLHYMFTLLPMFPTHPPSVPTISWANQALGLTQHSRPHALTVSYTSIPTCGGPYLSLRLSIGEPSLSGSLLRSGVPMQYRSLPTVIRKLCSSEDSERRLGERLCKLKKECKPINQGIVISATVRQVTLLCLTRGTWGAWINQKKKKENIFSKYLNCLQLLKQGEGTGCI